MVAQPATDEIVIMPISFNAAGELNVDKPVVVGCRGRLLYPAGYDFTDFGALGRGVLRAVRAACYADNPPTPRSKAKLLIARWNHGSIRRPGSACGAGPGRSPAQGRKPSASLVD